VVVSAKLDVGATAVAELQRLVLAHGDRGRRSDAGTLLNSQRIFHPVQTCFAAEARIGVERKPKPRLDFVTKMAFERTHGVSD